MFYDTFKELCSAKGISCNKAALEIGLSNATPTKWKKTGATPTGETLQRIADYFGVSESYLLGKDSGKSSLQPNTHDVLDEVDIAFYDGYRELNEDDKETVREMVRVMRARRAKRQEK